MIQRADDQEDTIRHRLQVYNDQTAPMVNFYQQQGVLKSIPGTGKVEDIFQRITQLLGKS